MLTHILANLVDESISDDGGRLEHAFTIKSDISREGRPTGSSHHVVGYSADSEEIVVVEDVQGPPHEIGTAYVSESHFGESGHQGAIKRLRRPFDRDLYEVDEVDGADRGELESALTGDSPVQDLRAIVDPIPAVV